MQDHIVRVKVWADRGCITRPDTSPERESYDSLTPSSGRGILEAILWKPEMYYQLVQIDVLKEIQEFLIYRNEIKAKASWDGQPISIEKQRTQRMTRGLRNVAYVIHARIFSRNPAKNPPMKYVDIFNGRVRRGQCYHRPYIGCREFAAFFGPVTEADVPIQTPERLDLGWMLFDQRYDQNGVPEHAVFFPAVLERGVMRVPQDLYQEVRR